MSAPRRLMSAPLYRGNVETAGSEMTLQRTGGSRTYVRASGWTALVFSALLAACATTEGPAEPAPAVQSLEQMMKSADEAQATSQYAKARDLYQDAAKAYPTAPEPWLRLSQGYFTANDYGHAVLAGEEVLQRDPDNKTAQSILAVSGLRITSKSLRALRKDAAFPVGSREEALTITRELREALGESALLAIKDPNAAPTKSVRRTQHKSNAAATPAAPAATTNSSASGSRPTPARSNPLDALQ
jgi:tetratricopeptide (TPR) repeat protein